MALTKRFVKPFLLIVSSMILAFPLFSLAYYTMVRTSTPQFCSSCHEIAFAYNTWKTSTHVNNGQGFAAVCMDCHLPAPQDTFNFFYAKTFHGIKDLAAHFFIGSYNHEENREKAYASIKNDQCLKCHQNIIYLPYKRGAMLAHRSVIYPRPGYELSCFECHRNLVHNQVAYYNYKACR